jgi:hypothetical protein
MGVDLASLDFQPAICARLIQAAKTAISPEAARYLMSLDFADADHARMQELIEKSNDGTLSAEEMAELDGYVNIANVLSVMHSQARVALRGPSFESARHSVNS